METVGFIALFGIVLSASILLIEFTEILIREKLTAGEGIAGPEETSYCGLRKDVFQECLAAAAEQRLMPILMTTLTTVGGLLSLMFVGGRCSRASRPSSSSGSHSARSSRCSCCRRSTASLRSFSV